MNGLSFLQSLQTEPWFITEEWYSTALDTLRNLGEAEMASPLDQGEPEIPGLEISAGYAFLNVNGPLDRNATYWAWRYFGVTSLRVMEAQLQAVESREDIHTLVMIYNTPGGRAVGVPEIAEQVARIGETKRVAGYVDTQCCSAGMYIAAPSHVLFAAPSAGVGSVSTIASVVDSSEAWKQNGLKRHVFTDGNLKSMGLSGVPLSAVQIAHLQGRVAEMGEAFKSFVETYRPGITREVMQGGTYAGQSALDAGFVDGFANNLADFVAHLIDTEAAE